MKEKRKLRMYKKLVSLCIVFLLFFTLLQATIVLGDEPNNIVYVNPSNQIVSPQESFEISIYCEPDQPIKSFEFKLSFDPSLLEANSVTEGDIFDGYSTYFNSGDINNSAGTIINVYGLILGAGNVSSPGSFADISFTAKDISGISSIDLYDFGVTNEASYVSISVSNGSVQIDGIPPEFTDNSPSQGYTGDSYTFSVYVSDNVDISSNLTVYVDWSHGGNSDNDSMIFSGGSLFEKTVTLDLNSVADLSYNFYAVDSYGNGNSTTLSTVTVLDNDNPEINNIQASPSTQEIEGYVNISAELTDNIAVNEVFLNITYPDSSYKNISITGNVSSNIYYCYKSYGQYGTHYYFIFASDSNNNKATSSTYSFIIGDFSPPDISNIDITTSVPLDTDPAFGWVNITCTVIDNVEVTQVYLNITNPGGSYNNLSMSSSSSDNYYLNSSTAFSGYGNYSYLIWAIDNDLNDESSSNSIFSMPPNYDVNMDGVQNVLDLVSVSNFYFDTGAPGWIRQDVDNNGKVEVLDFVIISNNYGDGWWE